MDTCSMTVIKPNMGDLCWRASVTTGREEDTFPPSLPPSHSASLGLSSTVRAPRLCAFAQPGNPVELETPPYFGTTAPLLRGPRHGKEDEGGEEGSGVGRRGKEEEVREEEEERKGLQKSSPLSKGHRSKSRSFRRLWQKTRRSSAAPPRSSHFSPSPPFPPLLSFPLPNHHDAFPHVRRHDGRRPRETRAARTSWKETGRSRTKQRPGFRPSPPSPPPSTTSSTCSSSSSCCPRSSAHRGAPRRARRRCGEHRRGRDGGPRQQGQAVPRRKSVDFRCAIPDSAGTERRHCLDFLDCRDCALLLPRRAAHPCCEDDDVVDG